MARRTPIYVDPHSSHWTVGYTRLSDQHVLILWADEEGRPLFSSVGDSEDLLGSLHESLTNLIAFDGTSPSEVRVPSDALASEWAKLFNDMAFVPNASEAVDTMLDYLGAHLGMPVPVTELAAVSRSDAPSDLPSINDLRDSFEAAALFYKKKPWKITDGAAVIITDSSAGIEGIVDLMGGKDPGLMFFDDEEAFVEYADLLAQLETGHVPSRVPPNISVSFGPASSVPKEVSASVRQEGWPIASRNAFPTVLVFDKAGPAAPCRFDYVTSTFVLRALAALTSVKAKVRKVLSTGEAASWTLRFKTPDGVEWVTIATPRGVSEAFMELSAACGFDEDNPDSWRALASELIRRFSESAYAKGVVAEHCRLVSEFAINYCGKPIIDVEAEDLVEIMLDWIPKKAMMSRADAYEMVKATRAFFEFLLQDYDLSFARECMEVSVDELAADMGDALDDPSGFGMAKSIVSAGAAVGFDVQSEEGLRAWMKSLEGKPLPDSISLPDVPGGLSRPKPKLKLVRSPKTKADKNKAKAKRKRKKR